MRIATLIVTTLCLLAASATGFLGAFRGMADATAIDALLGNSKDELGTLAAEDSGARELQSLANSTGSMRTGAGFFGAAGLAALVLLVLAFVNRGVPWAALALVVLAVAGTFISPHYNLGPFAPASARQLGYVVTVAALLGAGGAIGAWMLKSRRARTMQPQIAPAPSRA
jgi:hypothetical protein